MSKTLDVLNYEFDLNLPTSGVGFEGYIFRLTQA